MANNAVVQEYKKLSPTGKVIAVTATVLAVYKLGKWAFSDDKSGGTTQNLVCGSGNLSFPSNQYEVFADQIETAIWGTWGIPSPWEDDTAIGEILMSMQSTDDVCKLNNAYDVRTVGIFMQDGGNLVQTIHSYLDDDIKEEVNAYYQIHNIDWIWL